VDPRQNSRFRPSGEAYGRIEGPKGELGFISLATARPITTTTRPPPSLIIHRAGRIASVKPGADAVVILGTLILSSAKSIDEPKILNLARELLKHDRDGPEFCRKLPRPGAHGHVEYPENKSRPSKTPATFLFFRFDGDDAMKGRLCVASPDCERNAAAVHLYIKDTARSGLRWNPVSAKVFDIDVSSA